LESLSYKPMTNGNLSSQHAKKIKWIEAILNYWGNCIMFVHMKYVMCKA